ncbi:LytTR family DNA-binding domain-containing protein [uncultured Erythrobacter sp.]|uniref:LytR/AlgR family response regulator transcription factor n=1 Tax=uncultured Erythrobacter sp. TaxID=263913 RepID=UPI002639A791|nr:LytTR family DNA-binding domain-containing protein [uncultured Erythrobacter sp.]
MLRVAIVDDERLARTRIANAIEMIPEVEIVCEASDGEQAIKRIRNKTPSVVLLDIEMPHGDGFYVASRLLELPELPEIIFVTAFSSYAARAFEHGATDYLLKPFSEKRLSHALTRARERIRLKSLDERTARLQQLVERLRAEREQTEERRVVWFKSGNEQVRVFADEINYASADRDYLEIVTGQRVLHLRHTISALTEELGTVDFVRIHRSYLVRRKLIRGVRTLGQGKCEIELETGETLPVGAKFKDNLNNK